VKTIAFFNNKGGVGKTTLVYHLASLLSERGARVLAVDLDPQANLTSMFLEEDMLETIWPEGDHPQTIYGSLRPIIKGTGDVQTAHVLRLHERLGLVAGDLALSTFEDKLSVAWLQCSGGDESAFRTTTAFHRAIGQAAAEFAADWVLVDVGPNLGAINRAALIASERVVIPLGPDLFSLQGLRNLGPSLRTWRANWKELVRKNPDPSLLLPIGAIDPVGYIVMQPGMRGSRPVKAYQRWVDRFPGAYRTHVLEEQSDETISTTADPYCLAIVKHYRSLIPMSMESRKPVFSLKPADGAIGAHTEAVRSAYTDFLSLARQLAARVGTVVP
jgi:chromosome partitioning protein